MPASKAVGGRSIHAGPANSRAAAIREIADILERAGFPEDAYPAPDWERIGNERRLVAGGYGKPRPFIVNSRN